MRDKTTLTLMELVIMLVVFALAAVLCLRIFLWAEDASQQNADMDQALLQAQNAAETIKSQQGSFTAAAEKLGGSADKNRWVIFYDENWIISENGGTFTLNAVNQSKPEPYLGAAQIIVTRTDGTVLAQLDVCWQEVAADG